MIDCSMAKISLPCDGPASAYWSQLETTPSGFSNLCLKDVVRVDFSNVVSVCVKVTGSQNLTLFRHRSMSADSSSQAKHNF
jgi:hypothetical protein